MLLTKGKLENKIIDKLSHGPMLSTELVVILEKEEKTTIQGVYKSLKNLIDQEIVSKQKKMVSLNNAWIERLSIFTEEITDNYHKSEINDFLSLENGEKISYSFKDTTKLDVYWMHIFLLLSKKTKDPIFFFNAHQWFFVTRQETESTLFDWINRNNRQTFMVLGGDTPIDKKTAKELSSKNIHIHLDPKINLPRNRYVGVVGDYIFSTIYSKELQSKIDNFFDSHKKLDEENIKDLRKITQSEQRAKIVVERNSKKALKLRKRITKDFFVIKEIREKFLS